MSYEQIMQYDPILLALFATILTWLATALGSAMVFFFKTINQKALNAMLF
jgi:ZIP family zinc transporter